MSVSISLVYKNDKQSIQYLIFMNDVMKMFIAISELVFLIIHQVNISQQY